jgi:purine nucleoside phosphorylase
MERGEWIAEGDPPDLLLAEDQIAFLDPTIVDARGPKGEIAFVDMTKPFSSEALDDAERRCKEAGLVVRRGCVAGIRAIELLTPTERRAIHSLGADAVAVSIPQEVRSARAAGLEVLAVVVLKEILLDRVALVFA